MFHGIARRTLVALVVLNGFGTLALAQSEWKATYLANPKKTEERTVIGTDAGALEDKHWITVQYSEYPGFRPSMAMIVEREKDEALPEAETPLGAVFRDIARFTRDEDSGESSGQFSPDRMTPIVRPIVRTALGKTNRFRVVDRGVALDAAIAEQDMGAGGRVSKRSAVKIGNIRGASYGVKATVIEANPEKDVRSIKIGAGILGMAGGALGGIAVGGKVAFCRINVQVVDLETGDVIFDTMVDGTASEKTRNWGAAAVGLLTKKLPFGIGGAGVQSQEKQEAILTDAVTACAMKAAHHIATRMEDRPFQTSVAKFDGERVWLIGGSDLGMRPGMSLTLLSNLGYITDPASGDTIDVDTKSIGQVRVVEVKEKVSVCEVVGGGAGGKAGDLARYEMAKK